MALLRIAMAQINTIVGDLEGNARKMGKAVTRARDLNADLVLFPELALCGYPPEDLLLKPGFLGDCKDKLEQVTQQIEGICAVVGFPHLQGGRVYNAAALINGSRRLGVYYKVELPNYGVFDEKRYFSPGEDCLLINLNGIRIMPTICEDIWVSGAMPEQWAKENGVSVVLNLSASPFHADKLSRRKEILAGFAKRTKTFVCYNNLIGGQDELVFDGGSMVVDGRGELIAMAERFEENLLVVDLEVGPVSKKMHQSRNEDQIPGKYIKIEPPPSHAQREKKKTRLASRPTGIEEIYKALVLGTRDYVHKNGFDKVVVGLSGGIDSSLTAAIAVHALGEDKVIGVTMPSQYTSAGTLSDAELLAKNLGIRLITVPIKQIFDSYLAGLKEVFGKGEPGVEQENLQARVRGNILMALSNRFGWLVLTTGNKSETAVGYATLYGDMAGGFALIKDVPKTVVYKLAGHINERADKKLIPESVIARPPTAELKPGQKDEDSLPPYSVLDPILIAYVEQDRSRDEIAAMGFDPETIKKVIAMVDLNEYKRRQAPPGIKITPKAFGRDRRLPITNLYKPR